MISIDYGALIAFAVWFVWVVGTGLPLACLLIDLAFNGRPAVTPDYDGPEVTVAAA